VKKRPVDIIGDDFSRILEIEFKRSLVGSEDELVGCFHRYILLLSG